MNFEVAPGHAEGDGCPLFTRGHYLLSSTELRETIATMLEPFIQSANARALLADKIVIEGVVDFLTHVHIDQHPGVLALDSAHRKHVSYVRHLLLSGEPNELNETIRYVTPPPLD